MQISDNTTENFTTVGQRIKDPPNIAAPKKAEREEVKENTRPQETKEPSKKTNSTKSKRLSWLKTVLGTIGNTASLAFNIFSAYSNAFSKDENSKKEASKLGGLGTKLFLLTNGTINFLEQFEMKNYLSSLGNFIDNIIALTVKQPQVYLARGLSLGLYTIANSIGILNNRSEFNSFGDHMDHIIDGVKKTMHMLIDKPLETLQSAKNGALGTVSGVLTILGFLTWQLTGSEKIGATLRDFGGLLIDLEQAKPSHLKEGRKFYFAAGVTYIFGTVCDYLSKWLPKHKGVLVPLGFATDIIGRSFLRISQLTELGKGQDKENPIEWKDTAPAPNKRNNQKAE